jgi:putative DNA primase/helicase
VQIDALLTALGQGGPVEDERGGVLVRCPAHDDGRPSLFVSLKPDGRALVHCRAGCKTSDVDDDGRERAGTVLHAAGLTSADLYGVAGEPTISSEPPADLDPGHLAALALYVDKAAALYPGSPADTYAAERFGITRDVAAELRLGYDGGDIHLPRRADFRPRDYTAYPRLVVPFLDAHGVARGLQGRDLSGECPRRWVNLANPDGSRWDATGVFRTDGAYPTVVVTEGPGDGLASAAIGYTVVVVRGAGVAKNARAVREILAAAGDSSDIVVFPDNDAAGRQFLASLGAGLADAGCRPRVGAVPAEVNDVGDWRTLGGNFASEFHTAVGAALPWRPAEPDEQTAPPPRHAPPVGDDRTGTDIANARRALDIVGPDTKHVDGVGFLQWDGRVWQVMSAARERTIGHRVADALYDEYMAMEDGEKGTAVAKAKAKALARMRSMHNDAGMQAMLRNLQAITGAEVGEFDAHHHLVSFANGTVDLRTGELRPHSRDDRLTKLVDVEYDPAAECPRWERFLAELFPGEPGMPSFLQRLVGYGITGETREHVFALLYGHGSNGKSVFVNTVGDVFAGITGRVSQAAVAYQRNFDPGAANPALAALRGVRLAIMSELSDGLRLNEALLKQLTAGDPVTARELYKGQFTFTPTALMVMATNYKPDVRGQDDGFWRRTRLIPFAREFTGRDVDPTLPATLRAEAPGIAAWAVRGAVDWYAKGLVEPASVAEAVAEYRRSSDILDGYLPGVLVRDPAGKILLKQAFTLLEDWREDENVEQVAKWGATTLRRQLENRKVTAAKRKEGMTLLGVRAAKPGE